ncbi:MAG TPA: TIGR02391 family protein [Methylotenera sp.]|nr:TIGR02391 family protein [Methylotenera sp.]
MIGTIKLKSLAGIQYHGIAGISQDCKRAVINLLQYPDKVLEAKLLSSSGTHCFLLKTIAEDLVAIKSGFSSGYRGEGPGALSVSLQLLREHNVQIDEYQVEQSLIDRLDQSCLTLQDLEQIENARPVRPSRWFDYIHDNHLGSTTSKLIHEFPDVIPYAIINHRLIDLARQFFDQPDSSILSGFRRLEDIVRERTKEVEHGAKLFSKAFQGEESILYWKDIDSGEQQGRAQLFTGTYMAYRNRRAHRELTHSTNESLHEFLLLNHLFVLESKAIKRVIQGS